jgi:O-antigen/teichoic acid export membrane protein
LSFLCLGRAARKPRVRSSLSSAVIGRITANAISILTSFLTIRLYNLYVSKEVYGTFLVGLQIIGYLPLLSGGFRTVINRQVLAEPDTAVKASIARFGQLLQSYFFIFVVLFSMALMAAYSQEPGARATGLPALIFVAAGLAASIYFQAGTQLGLLIAVGEQVKSSFIQAGWGLVTLLILWICFRLGWGAWAFPASNGFGALIIIGVCQFTLYATSTGIPLFVWSTGANVWSRLKAIWWPALACLSSQGAMLLVFTTDLIIIGIVVGPGAAAVYGIAARAGTISRMVLNSLSEAAWPHLAEELDLQRKAKLMRKIDRLNAWLAGAWHGAMVVTLHTFLVWLVKPDWVAPQGLILLMLTRSILVSISSAHGYGLLSAGRFKELANISVIEGVIGVVAGIVLSYAYGYYGTAIAYLAATCCGQSWRMTREYFRYAHDTHWMKEWLAIVSRALIAGAIAALLAAGALGLSRYLPAPPGLLAVVGGAIGFGVPAAFIFVLWRRNRTVL